MVQGSLRSRSKVRKQVRTVSGTKRRYERKKPGKAVSPAGKPLPGVASGTKTQIAQLGKTERRPSRPYGGVLSSPEMREVFTEKVQEEFSLSGEGKLYAPGSVCVKIAGRDAGKLCVITEVIDQHFVKIDGFTRPKKVNVKHIEPIGKSIVLKKGATSKDIQAILA